MTTGSITLNELMICEVDADPTVSGVDAPIGSIAILDGGAKMWQKAGPGSTAWLLVTVSSKSGLIAKTAFAGNPKKSSVEFDIPYPTTNYTPNIISEEGRFWSYEGKTTDGFVINTNANQALNSDVRWSCVYDGETA